MRVMLTGATGFLGGHLLAQLRESGAQVSVLVRSPDVAKTLAASGVDVAIGSIDDPRALSDALQHPTDCIFHAAADTSPWRANAARQTQTNVEGTRQVLSAAVNAGVRRIVYTSSVSAFGQQDSVLTEISPRLGAQSWINYERTKAIAEELVFEADAKNQIEALVMNPSHILGPGDTQNWARLFMLVDQQKLPGAPPGSGAFADVREVARAQLVAWRRGKRGEQFLLGGEQATFLELVQLIAVQLGRKSPQRPMPAIVLKTVARVMEGISRFTHREPDLTPESVSYTCHHLRVDSSKAIRELDYRVTPMATLVADTCAWLRSQALLRDS